MDRPAAADALRQAFTDWIEAGHPRLIEAVAYPDVRFEPPKHPDPWIRWSMEWTGTLPAGAGDQLDLHTGMAFVELYWPSGEGYKDVNEMAEAISEFYRAFEAAGGNLRCRSQNDRARPSWRRVGSEPGYTRRIVDVPIRLFQPR